MQLTHNIIIESSDNSNDVLVSTESCDYIMKTKEVKVSHVTQNEYIEKINIGNFFEYFSVTLPYSKKNTKSNKQTKKQRTETLCPRDTSSVEVCGHVGPLQQKIF